jgi:hypothetical protein
VSQRLNDADHRSAHSLFEIAPLRGLALLQSPSYMRATSAWLTRYLFGTCSVKTESACDPSLNVDQASGRLAISGTKINEV